MLCNVTTGKHRFSPISLGLYFRQKRIVRKVCFDESCRYDLGNEQGSINKLFGIGYLPGHHKYSARFGWTYNKLSKQIDVWAYTYDKGEREFKKVGSVEIGSYYIFRLTIHSGQYLFEIGEDYTGRWKRLWNRISGKTHSKWFGYRLGLFFGGLLPAPHNMNIIIKRV